MKTDREWEGQEERKDKEEKDEGDWFIRVMGRLIVGEDEEKRRNEGRRKIGGREALGKWRNDG